MQATLPMMCCWTTPIYSNAVDKHRSLPYERLEYRVFLEKQKGLVEGRIKFPHIAKR